MLKPGTRLSLIEHLLVLFDVKYQKQSDRDQAWVQSFHVANFVLGRLIKEADQSKADAEKIRDSLRKVLSIRFLIPFQITSTEERLCFLHPQFHDTTKEDVVPLVDILVKKYSTGPNDNPKSNNKTYLAYLNEDLANNTKELSATLDEYRRKYEDWVSRVDYFFLQILTTWITWSGLLTVRLTANRERNSRRNWRGDWLDPCLRLDPDRNLGLGGGAARRMDWTLQKIPRIE